MKPCTFIRNTRLYLAVPVHEFHCCFKVALSQKTESLSLWLHPQKMFQMTILNFSSLDGKFWDSDLEHFGGWKTILRSIHLIMNHTKVKVGVLV